MNSLDNSNPTNVNDIIKNFSNMVRSFAMKETEWQISKENYEKKIAQLEGELRAHENINIDLLKRIRMLEYELAKERKDKNIEINANEDLYKDLQYPNLIKEEDLKFLEETANKPSLLSILQSIGIDENLANNLFTDFELNKNELEAMIKKDIEDKLLKSENNNVNNMNEIQNDNKNTKYNNQNNINNNINKNYKNVNNNAQNEINNNISNAQNIKTSNISKNE